MQKQLELREEMSAVRRRGLVNAQVLADRVEKLSDWREHVRAHPWPIALAVGALAYWVVPTRAQSTGTGTAALRPSPTPNSGTGTAGVGTRAGDDVDREAKVAGIASIGGAAMGFVGSLIGNAVRSYVSEQVQTLITSRGNHATSQQRQAPSSRF